MYWTLWLGAAYLLGSIPTAVWVSRLFFGEDVRSRGSGNAGATNMMRNYGWKAGLLVLLIDILKGALAVFLPSLLVQNEPEYAGICWALAAAIGHIWPVWAGFRGGKAVATLLGAMLALSPLLAGLAVAEFALLLLISRYVSLASLITGWTFAAAYYYVSMPDGRHPWYIFLLPLLLTYTHRSNIERLMLGSENRFGKKKDMK